jgi:hypothetical protein
MLWVVERRKVVGVCAWTALGPKHKFRKIQVVHSPSEISIRSKRNGR